MFSASVAVPTLENLLQYDSVMLVLNTPFGDPAANGDVLADYVDAGGGLVMTLASIATGFNPTGRLLTGGYFPVEPGIGPSGSSNLGVFDASHPIMDGVTTAFGDALALLDPAEGAEVVAEWEIAEPFVVTKGGSVVAVNIFVSGTGFWAGDVPLILHNAVAWSANAVTWLSTVPVDGVVPAGESLDVMVVFDAAALDGGDYNADILVQQ